MKDKFYRLKNTLIYNASKFLSFYRWCLLVFFIIFLFGLITGILTASNYASIITYENLINKYLIKFLLKETSYLSYFIRLSIYFIIISLSVIFFTKNWFFVIVDGVLLAILGYIYGFDLCIIIISFKLSGVIFGIFVLGLWGLIIFLCLISIISIAIRRFLDYKKSCDIQEKTYYPKIYITFILLAILSIFFKSLFFAIIHIFVIVD